LVTIGAFHSNTRASSAGFAGMNKTVISHPIRCAAGAVALALAASIAPAAAQQPFPQPQPPSVSPRNPACVRLEAQLTSLDRGSFDPGRADQIKRYEDTAARQQAELDRVTAQARRSGCEGRGFFSLFGGQPAQCTQINSQIQQMRANLDRVLADLQQLQGNSADREGQRRSVLAALGQNDCGPQYRQYANRGFFDNLFGGGGPGTIFNPTPDQSQGDTFRTLCVRTCDGYYFPISYSTVAGKFADDEKVCRAMCPAAEVTLYSYRNPGGDIAQAVSASGQPYTELPNAFAYRKAFNPSCGCKGIGQTWADALKHLDDQTVEGGDIVVNEERARQLSLPQTDANGKPIVRPAVRPASSAPKNATPVPAAATTTPPPEDKSEPGKRQVRTVGPTFLPAH
jgi:hypothetical protein